jgi:hypothetical protein
MAPKIPGRAGIEGMIDPPQKYPRTAIKTRLSPKRPDLNLFVPQATPAIVRRDEHVDHGSRSRRPPLILPVALPLSALRAKNTLAQSGGGCHNWCL